MNNKIWLSSPHMGSNEMIGLNYPNSCMDIILTKVNSIKQLTNISVIPKNHEIR